MQADVFSRSSRDEDDEEALKWAALEKLPTYSRMRKGIMTTPAGELQEVDIENLSYQEKKNLLDKLVRVAEEDNEKFLLKLKSRIDQYDPSAFMFLIYICQLIVGFVFNNALVIEFQSWH